MTDGLNEFQHSVENERKIELNMLVMESILSFQESFFHKLLESKAFVFSSPNFSFHSYFILSFSCIGGRKAQKENFINYSIVMRAVGFWFSFFFMIENFYKWWFEAVQHTKKDR